MGLKNCQENFSRSSSIIAMSSSIIPRSSSISFGNLPYLPGCLLSFPGHLPTLPVIFIISMSPSSHHHVCRCTRLLQSGTQQHVCRCTRLLQPGTHQQCFELYGPIFVCVSMMEDDLEKFSWQFLSPMNEE